jgi:hypothetical protein
MDEKGAARKLKKMMSNDPLIHRLHIHPSIELAYKGPDFSFGPLPALFYFALSAQDSLNLDPLNQPVAYLSSSSLRIFSMTLPGHENHLPPTQALHFWANKIAQGHNLITEFIEKIKTVIETLLHQHVLIPDRIAVAGLSRGSFIATHAAASIDQFRWILGFAPLTDLSYTKEFQDLYQNPDVKLLSLEHCIPFLINRPLRYYIGNHDTRVGTRQCFDFVEKLATAAFDSMIRSPQVELMIAPSIGRDGHGTSQEIFHEGAQWIAEKLGVADVL